MKEPSRKDSVLAKKTSEEISPAKLALLKSKIADVKVAKNDEPSVLKKIYKDGLTDEYYYQHPLLSGFDRDFVEDVIGIDQNTILSPSVICSFGAQAQSEMGILMTEIASCLGKITTLEINTDLEIVVKHLRSLDIENFDTKVVFGLLWNKRVKCTIQDYITAFETASTEVETTVERITTKMSSTSQVFERIQYLITNQNILTKRLSQYIIVGKMILERRVINDMMLIDQFEKRVQDLETFYHVSELTLKQSSLNYQNCVSQIIDAYSTIKTTLPIWQARYAALLSKWQVKKANPNTPLSEISDESFVESVNETRELVKLITEATNTTKDTTVSSGDLGPL